MKELIPYFLALELLAKFIENGPGLDNKAEAKALLDFFRARLDDQPSVHAAVCGILAVLSKTSVPVDKEVIIGLSQRYCYVICLA